MRRVALLLMLLPFVVGIVVFAATDQTPLVSRDETLSAKSIAEARRLLASNDPRSLQRGDERTAVVPAVLIDAAVNHWASRALGARAAFLMGEDTAEIQISVPALGIAAARYLNLRVVFLEAKGEPKIIRGSIGSLPVPAVLVEWLIGTAIRIAGYAQEWQLATQAIRRLAFEPARGTVDVSYVWEPQLLDRVRSLAFTPEDIVRLHAAQIALAGLLDHYAPRSRLPLSRILAPLLRCCGDETLQTSRAALLVLATYLAGKDLAQLLPQARSWPHPRRLTLTLLGREDSAQHFGISAALAIWAGEPAAKAIGMYKEIDDSRGGSGFSFADLAADRAGTRFGELLVESSAHLHAALRGTLSDADLLASPAGLPESLSEADFRRRFGDGDNLAYRELASEIERRLTALPLYR